MNKSFVIGIGIFAVVIAIISIFSFNTQVDSVEPQNMGLVGDVSIGTLIPITGDLSLQGEERKAAAEMAVRDFNDFLKENNANWNLKLVSEDSGTNPVTALEKLTSFHAKNIQLIIGPSTSSELRNIMGYASSNDMLLFSPSSTAPSIAIPGDNVYRLTSDDTKQGPAIARLITDNGVNVIIQVARADAWGNGLSSTISESFVENGGTVAQTIMYNPESPELSVTASLLAKSVNDQINLHGVENVGVVIIGFSETLQFMQSASQYDVLDDVVWFGTDGNAKEQKITSDPIGVEFANKVSFSATILSVVNNEIYQNIEDRLVEQLGRVPNTYAFSTYDIVWILGLAMYETDSSDVSDLTLIIPKIASNYNGAIGNTKLNAAGDLDAANYDVWGVRDGQWVMIGMYDSNTDTIIEKGSVAMLAFDKDIFIPKQKSQAQSMVDLAIADYSMRGSLAFADYDASKKYHDGERYIFVIRMSDNVFVSHGNRSDLIDTMITDLVDANGINIGQLFVDNITSEGAWVEYQWENPTNNQMDAKLTWIKSFDGYIFAVGTYSQ